MKKVIVTHPRERLFANVPREPRKQNYRLLGSGSIKLVRCYDICGTWFPKIFLSL